MYVAFPSDSNARLPPSTSPSGVNTNALFSFVLSLSVTVTTDALTVDQERALLPLVDKTWPLDPAPDGNAIVVPPKS